MIAFFLITIAKTLIIIISDIRVIDKQKKAYYYEGHKKNLATHIRNYTSV